METDERVVALAGPHVLIPDDGTFTSRRIAGDGLLARRLRDLGLRLLMPDDLDQV
jgi:hypothetical protein